MGDFKSEFSQKPTHQKPEATEQDDLNEIKRIISLETPPVQPPPPLPSPRAQRSSLLKTYGLPLVLLVTLMVLGGMFVIPLFQAEPEGLGGPELAPGRVPSTASLTISTYPDGAVVYLDSDSVGVTPLSLAGLAPQTYLLTLSKPEHVSLNTAITLTESQPNSFSYYLDKTPDAVLARQTNPPRTSPVRATSSPSSDNNTDNRSATTDTPPPAPTPGISQETTEPPRQQPEEPVAETVSDDTAAVVLNMSEAGTLFLRSTPSGATVVVGGRRTNVKTPATIQKMAGLHEVTLELDGYTPSTRTVEVKPGETTQLGFTMVPLIGTLEVTVRPWGIVYIDGERILENVSFRKQITLSALTHRVRIEHPELGRVWERDVTVPTGDTPYLLSVNFNQIVALSVDAKDINDRSINGNLYADNTLMGQTPLRIALPVGQHTLEVRADGYTQTGIRGGVVTRGTSTINVDKEHEGKAVSIILRQR